MLRVKQSKIYVFAVDQVFYTQNLTSRSEIFEIVKENLGVRTTLLLNHNIINFWFLE